MLRMDLQMHYSVRGTHYFAETQYFCLTTFCFFSLPSYIKNQYIRNHLMTPNLQLNFGGKPQTAIDITH
uniref:Uncharacterized protein n=1 Tax=Anguilla anguilla TaxID=7936 RepID=A0A0E9RDE6_ANGAN